MHDARTEVTRGVEGGTAGAAGTGDQTPDQESDTDRCRARRARERGAVQDHQCGKRQDEGAEELDRKTFARLPAELMVDNVPRMSSSFLIWQ
jgi:hypothetical protein